jgi:XRE family transcriptional regulator, regulator of sulfur utilization
MRKADKAELRIRSFREAKGYTQEYMAEMLDICQSTYANLESGKSSLTIDRLLEIAEILELDFHQLLVFTGKGPGDGNSPVHDLPSVNHLHEETKKLYDQLVQDLRSEINFLRSMIRP